jgi:predicted Zn-dependent peptidase
MPTDLLRWFTLGCGARLAVERMPGTRSAAAAVMLPVGTAGDPDGDAGEGESTVLAELILRGAGGISSRDYSDAFDALGAQRHGAAAVHHLSLSTLCMGERLPEALRLLSLAVLRPNLDPDGLDAVRAIALQSLAGLQDEPQHLAGVALRRRAMPAPFNRSGYGTEAGLNALAAEGIRAAWHRRARPGGTVIGIAGDVHPERVRDLLERLFEGWSGTSEEPRETAPAERGRHLVRIDTQQTHIAIGLDAPPDGGPDSYAHRVAIRVLGGATSSRLFTEVREKRGLCYSVGASSALGRDRGLVQIYAGSTHERAPRTLECILQELDRFERGISEDEFRDALVGAKAGLVMSGESSSARAAAIASQLWRIGRAMDLAESAAEFERLTLAGVNEYIARDMGAAWRSARTQVTVAPDEIR